MIFEVAGLFPTQRVLDEVRIQLTASPFRGVYVNNGEFDPDGTPLTFHR
jgi:hypothetical protein